MALDKRITNQLLRLPGYYANLRQRVFPKRFPAGTGQNRSAFISPPASASEPDFDKKIRSMLSTGYSSIDLENLRVIPHRQFFGGFGDLFMADSSKGEQRRYLVKVFREETQKYHAPIHENIRR